VKVQRPSMAALVVLALAGPAIGQGSARPHASKPMVLTGAIALPNVAGRIDHLGFDGKGHLFVSALGNNTEEVIDLSAGARERTISGIPKPQGVVYVPDFKKLFVGSDEGKLYIYDGEAYKLLDSIDFGDDVDNLRYDETSKRVFVGYGDQGAGAIATVDASTNKRLEPEFKLGAHPESFQLEKSGPHIYVNLPDLKQIAIVDRKTGAITRWPISLEGNFPMALDESGHRLFVATRAPARMAVLDTRSGHMIASFPCVQNSDDMFFDSARKRIYVAGGEGYLSIFEQMGPDLYQPIARVPSELGARTAGYPGKGLKGFDQFYLAVPARADHGAEILIYTVQD